MISTENQDDIAVVRMEHGKVQAMDVELFADLQRTLTELQASEAKAIILTGTGKAFSAGVDLFRLLKSGDNYIQSFVKILCDVFEQIFFFSKPIVAAVNGHAIAGGCVLTCACDYRVGVNTHLTIGVTELLVGVPYPAIALEIVRHAAAPQFLQQIVYSGKTYATEEAVKVGLLDESVPNDQLLERAMAVAKQLASVPLQAFAITKRRLREPVRKKLAMLPQEQDEILRAWRSPETHAMIHAYLDRTIGKRS